MGPAKVLALFLALASSSLCVQQTLARRTLQQMYFGDAPNNYYTPQRARFLRKNVNDLDALLKFVANGPVVTTTVFNKAYRDFAANWYYTLSRFGRVRDIVLVAYDTESLVECLTLGFACYNGTIILEKTKSSSAEFVSADVSHGNADYHKLMWGKPLIMNEILIRNYTCHYSDLDTVWLKDAVRSMTLAIEEHDADIIGMNDQNSGNPNAGNLLIKHNPRTVKMMEEWLAHGRPGAGQVRGDQHDQQGLWEVKGKAWNWCKTSAECLEFKKQGVAAVWLHPWHGCPWEHNDYAKSRWKGGICDNELAYIHIFCTAGGTRHKTEMASAIGVWFVDPASHSPIMRNAQAMDLIGMSPNHTIKGSPSLPCDNELAWLGM